MTYLLRKKFSTGNGEKRGLNLGKELSTIMYSEALEHHMSFIFKKKKKKNICYTLRWFQTLGKELGMSVRSS